MDVQNAFVHDEVFVAEHRQLFSSPFTMQHYSDVGSDSVLRSTNGHVASIGHDVLSLHQQVNILENELSFDHNGLQLRWTDIQ